MSVTLTGAASLRTTPLSRKKIPPVLQISLNRYEYDIDSGEMVKNNQKLKFRDILDFEPII
jgi:hypothetical protein